MDYEWSVLLLPKAECIARGSVRRSGFKNQERREGKV